LTIKDAFAVPSPDAYETLLWDVMNDDATLFMRADQIEAAWQVLMPVLEAWAESTPRNFPNYAAGTWGPKAADAIAGPCGTRLEAHRMRVLVIDIGGTHVKVLATGHKQRVEFAIWAENDPHENGSRGAGRHQRLEIRCGINRVSRARRPWSSLGRAAQSRARLGWLRLQERPSVGGPSRSSTTPPHSAHPASSPAGPPAPRKAWAPLIIRAAGSGSRSAMASSTKSTTRVDQPNTRDFQFLISDGETFCHEEKRDLDHRIEYPERDCLFYRSPIQNPRALPADQAHPRRSASLGGAHAHQTRSVRRVVARQACVSTRCLAPHIARQGAGNSGWCSEIGGNNLLHAERKGCIWSWDAAGFSRRSVGYVGASDGWQDLMKNFKMDWEFRAAGHGNIALTGEIVFRAAMSPLRSPLLLGSCQSTVAKLLQSLAEPFEAHREAYVRQWQRTVVNPKFDFSAHTSDGGHMYRLSRCILLAHEDKTFQGALVASMSIPWGETKGDERSGRLSPGLDPRPGAERDRPAGHGPDRDSAARFDLAGGHSADGRQIPTE
jgi:hypothetical protein